jgi:hypothetical protein
MAPESALKLLNQVLHRGNDENLIVRVLDQMPSNDLSTDYGLPKSCGEDEECALSPL